MRRWTLITGFGLFLSLGIVAIDLPFEGFLYDSLMRLRGLEAPHPDIVILKFDPAHDQQHEWLSDLSSLFERLEKVSPKAVAMDFKMKADEVRQLKFEERGYALFFYERDHSHHDHLDEEPAPPPILIGSPGQMPHFFQKDSTEIGMVSQLDIGILKKLAPEKLNHQPTSEIRLLNVVGPPGTYKTFFVHSILHGPKQLAGLKNKIILIAPPAERSHVTVASLPFYPKGGVRGASAVEVHANILDNFLRNRSIGFPAAWISILLTVAVTCASVVVLFGTVPILGVLAVILTTVLLVISALTALHEHLYLDILKPIVAIAFAYYFLIPYRLIVEYKGRWRYQQENKLLSEVETLKDNFMSLVSHNLKTPIARIEGIAQNLLAQKEFDAAALRSELESVLRSTEDLTRFVSRILRLTRVERPEYQIKISSRDLNSIVEKVVESHQRFADEKDISIKTNLEPLFPAPMDEELVRESIANLVENGIKYTPEGGTVEISTNESGDWIQVHVSDNGPGISDEDRGNIFAKFYRGAEVKNKGVRGSGLGLYLVKYFIELHGGTIEVKPKPEGGTVFTINLLSRNIS